MAITDSGTDFPIPLPPINATCILSPGALFAPVSGKALRERADPAASIEVVLMKVLHVDLIIEVHL